MPQWVIERLSRALNFREKTLKNSRILVLGMAYKPDVDDDRESPSRELISILFERGARVSYHDPYIPEFKGSRNYAFKMKSIPLTSGQLKKFDAVLIATDHHCIDYQFVVDHSTLVLDTRNATSHVRRHKKRIVKA
jgi:UDP-N-acetyl-D-glucosamine dehydrogenase